MSRTKRRQYKSGAIYKRASDGRWVGAIEGGWTAKGTRRRITVTAKTEPECKRKVDEKKRALARNEASTVARASVTTVKSWAEQWLKITVKTSRPKTYVTDAGAVNKWIVPTIGTKRLVDLTPADVRAVGTAITDGGGSTSTAHRYHGVLMRLLTAAKAEGYEIPAFVFLVKPPSEAVNDRQALSVEGALAMLEVAQYLPHGSRWAIALLQGMRQAECLGLTWDEVDLDAGTLRVSWQLQVLPYVDKADRSKGFQVPDGYEAKQLDKAVHLVRPKSKAGWRVLPLVPWVVDALRHWREVAPVSPHGLVWPGVKGRPARATDDRDEWKALQGAAGVGHPNGRYFELHEARDTTATLLLELGVDESVRIAIMGHSSIAVTRGYEFVNTSESRKALEGVAERLRLAPRPALP